MNPLKRVQHRGRQADRAQQGSNLVEMALILPLLLLLLAAIADFGRAFNHYIVITNAAREGARRATRIPQTAETDAVIRSAVIQEAANSGVDLTDDAGLTVITISPLLLVDRDTATPITVTVEYTFTTIMGGLVGLPEFPMRTQTGMMLFEGYPTPTAEP